LARVVREFAEATDRRLSRLEEDVTELKADVAGIKVRLDGIEAKQDEHSETLAGHTRVLDEHSETLAGHTRVLNEHSETLAGHTRVLNEHSEMLTEQRDILDEHGRILTRHGGQLAHLVGHDFEGLVVEPARRKIRDALGLSRLTIFSQHRQQGAVKLSDLTRESELAGVISDDDQADLANADIVFAGTNQGESVFVVAEISITVELDDVEHAAHRASLLHQATGVPALAAVIGAGIDAVAAREADNSSVAFAQVSEEEADSYRR
jgi:hypothetical protein